MPRGAREGALLNMRPCAGSVVSLRPMPEKPWTVEHFSQANPAGPGQGSVPGFLRRLADSVEALGPVEVQDIAFHMELDGEGEDWPSATVYFHRV